MTELNGAVIPMVSVPLWFAVALKEVGIQEVAGKGANPRITEYLRTCPKLPDELAVRDETPWCSAFVNYCMIKAGVTGTNSAAARSWLSWGVRLKTPQLGAAAVLWRDTPTSPSGHVAFYLHHTDRWIWLWGGNHDNGSGLKRYSIERLIEYRWAAPLASRLP